MKTQHYRLSLTLKGPLLSQASGTLAFGTDTAMQRYQGCPALNGALIRGTLRHLLVYRFDRHHDYAKYLDDWFPDEPGDGISQRSTLNFDLFWLAQQPPHDETRIRIEIDDDKGRVSDGSLQIIEDVFPAGTQAKFSGQIRASFRDNAEQACFEKWLDKALQWQDAIGSLKGVGFGRIEGYKLTPIDPPAISNALEQNLTPKKGRIGLRLRLDRPLCLGKVRSKSDNRIVSSNHIPGEVIKGILARRLAEQCGVSDPAKLSKALASFDFDNIVIQHARPVADGQTQPAAAMPFNLACFSAGFQRLTGSPDQLRQQAATWTSAPTLRPDWKQKDWQAAADHLRIDTRTPQRLLLVRTAIDETTQTARESALFSLECVEPKGFTWQTEIDLSQLPKQKQRNAWKKLQELIGAELDGIGKTGACASVQYIDASPPDNSAIDSTACWQITLQTPARLLPPDMTLPNVNSDEALHHYYQDYWDQVAPDCFELINYFAQQTLKGGDDHYHRFQKPHCHAYTPEWLTTAGSVFILQARPGKADAARDKLRHWLRANLPAWQRLAETQQPTRNIVSRFLHKPVEPPSDPYPARWNHSPTLPEHGYGEITITAVDASEEKSS